MPSTCRPIASAWLRPVPWNPRTRGSAQSWAARGGRVRRRQGRGGARGLDTFREDWWQEFRQSETDFARDENDYRRGFEAAFEADNRGKPLAEDADTTDAYRKGYRRGFDYYRKFY